MTAGVLCSIVLATPFVVSGSGHPEPSWTKKTPVLGAWEWVQGSDRDPPPFGGHHPSPSHWILSFRDSGVLEHWVKSPRGIFRCRTGSFRIVPAQDTHEWNVTVGSDTYRCLVRGDTLTFQPTIGSSGTQTYIRYYELQVPAWTLEPQVFPEVRVMPGAMSSETTDSLRAPPTPIDEVLPVYPSFAWSAGITGKVVTHVLVGKDGRVKNVKIVQSVTGLSEAAMHAARQWTFQPAILDGDPVPSWITVTFTFRIP